MIFHKFTDNLYYLFRAGMSIPRSVVREIFHLHPIEDYYRDLLYKTKGGRVAGTGILNALNNSSRYEVFYDLEYLQKTSPKLANQFLSGLQPSSAIPKEELARGIISGILKCDSRGYYFSATAREEKRRYD